MRLLNYGQIPSSFQHLGKFYHYQQDMQRGSITSLKRITLQISKRTSKQQTNAQFMMTLIAKLKEKFSNIALLLTNCSYNITNHFEAATLGESTRPHYTQSKESCSITDKMGKDCSVMS
uniref:Uncharacterized protein n=1 Tax=Glossina pallidipes TaxID=7398 RepID=A0A1A9ZDG4_GLOPL